MSKMTQLNDPRGSKTDSGAKSGLKITAFSTVPTYLTGQLNQLNLCYNRLDYAPISCNKGQSRVKNGTVSIDV